MIRKQGILIKQNLIFLSKDPPPTMVHQRDHSGERYPPFAEPLVYSFIRISQSPNLRSSPTHQGENMGAVHGAPRGRKAYTYNVHTMGCGLVPYGGLYDTAVPTPVPCKLQHLTVHLGLGIPEPR